MINFCFCRFWYSLNLGPFSLFAKKIELYSKNLNQDSNMPLLLNTTSLLVPKRPLACEVSPSAYFFWIMKDVEPLVSFNYWFSLLVANSTFLYDKMMIFKSWSLFSRCLMVFYFDFLSCTDYGLYAWSECHVWRWRAAVCGSPLFFLYCNKCSALIWIHVGKIQRCLFCFNVFSLLFLFAVSF